LKALLLKKNTRRRKAANCQGDASPSRTVHCPLLVAPLSEGADPPPCK
jgi:hypothetical protein